MHPDTTTIDGRTFALTRMPARKALGVKLRIVKLLAPVAGDASALAGGLPPRDDLVRLLEKGVQGLDVDVTVDLIADLCETARVVGGDRGGEHVEFDVDFHDDLTPAYKLAWEVVNLNFSKYLKEWGLQESPLEGKPQTPETSTNTQSTQDREGVKFRPNG